MTQVIKSDAAAGDTTSMVKVLELKDLAAEARQIVLDARKEAARIVADSREHVESTMRDARAKGYADGIEQGQAEGAAAARKQTHHDADRRAGGELSALTRLVKRIAFDLSAAKADVLAQARHDMLLFALELTEKIVSRVTIYDISAAKANLAKALELTGPTGKVTIKVNPAQLDSLHRHAIGLVEALSIDGEVNIVADKQISHGGVKAVTQHGEIDATVATQLDNVVTALLGRCDADAEWVRDEQGEYVSDNGNV